MKLSKGDVGMNEEKGWGMMISQPNKGSNKATTGQELDTLAWSQWCECWKPISAWREFWEQLMVSFSLTKGVLEKFLT